MADKYIRTRGKKLSIDPLMPIVALKIEPKFILLDVQKLLSTARWLLTVGVYTTAIILDLSSRLAVVLHLKHS